MLQDFALVSSLTKQALHSLQQLRIHIMYHVFFNNANIFLEKMCIKKEPTPKWSRF